ncbi:HD-GYP domain-containing protein [Desulfosarcina ovata]|nr:HD domain-containing phosphohydrolase [Desulfosarcina ovata]
MDSFTKRRKWCCRTTSKINNVWNNIISNFLFRMMISGVLLSVFWGWLVYVYQTNQVEKELFFQLEKASQRLIKENTVPFEKIDNFEFEHFVDFYSHQLADFRMVILDIYSINGQRVFHFNNGLKNLEKYKGMLLTQSPHSKDYKYNIFKLGGEIYFQTFNPIYKGEQHLGAINIIVAVEKRIVRQFRKAMIVAILHAIGTISTMTLVLFPLIHSSYKKLQHNQSELTKSHLQTIKALGNAIAERDSDTDAHNYRVTYLSLGLAERLNLSDRFMRSLVKGAFLHDIGKIGIRDNILLKTSSLSNEEMAIMKTHVEQGVKIINNIPWLEDSIDVIRFHHERYDGSGYPSGIRGEQIPIVARIFAVVDVFDALISKRPYKQAISCNDAIEILKQDHLKFDPLVLSIFLEISKSQCNNAITMEKEELEMHLTKKISNYFDV